MIKQLTAYFCLFLSSVFPINAGEINLKNNDTNTEILEILMASEEIALEIGITVKTIVGTSETFHLFDNQLVLDLKLEIEKAWGIPVKKQRLIYAGVTLMDEMTFRYYGIQDGSSVLVALNLNSR